MPENFYPRLERLKSLDIPIKQHPEEIRLVYGHLATYGISTPPQGFIEVGAMAGATFFLYCGLLREGALAIAVDDGRRNFKTRERLKRVVGALRQEGIDAHWVRGNSHEVTTLKKVVDIKRASGQQVHLLHIDGDHSAKGSLRDWQDYGPLVDSKGVTLFHDIRATTPCHVDETWTRVCNSGNLTRAICCGPFTYGGHSHKACGIGMVYMGG